METRRYEAEDMAALLLAVLFDMESRKEDGVHFWANVHDNMVQIFVDKTVTQQVALIEGAGKIRWMLDNDGKAMIEQYDVSPAEIEDRIVKIAYIIAKGEGDVQLPPAGFEASQRQLDWWQRKRGAFNLVSHLRAGNHPVAIPDPEQGTRHDNDPTPIPDDWTFPSIANPRKTSKRRSWPAT